MKQELNEQELENVVGGTVIISQDYMVISYTTIGKKKQLRNCSYRQNICFYWEKRNRKNHTFAEVV